MPYAQHHHLFDSGVELTSQQFPAQFIAEGLDQTRGWFYSLIVLGTALFGKSPFENVIVNGTVLAEDGRKMSKSLRNYPDPMELVDRVGADAMRYYLLTAPIMRAEDLSFSEKEVLEQQRKNIGRLHNVLAMYEMYKDGTVATADSTNILDRWIIARLNQVVSDATIGYKNYELDKANRGIADLIDDVSVWYLRRSRERLKSNIVEDKKLALGTLRFVLRELAKVMAPAMPFYAEYLFQAVKEESESESVHLCAWPPGGDVDIDIIAGMMNVRSFANMGLKLRAKEMVGVRQPLSKCWIAHGFTAPKYWNELESILADELNVKQVILRSTNNEDNEETFGIDFTLTSELRDEGIVREAIRTVQDLRSKYALVVNDKILLTASTTGEALLSKPEYLAMIERVTGAKIKFEVFNPEEGTKVPTESLALFVKIEKI